MLALACAIYFQARDDGSCPNAAQFDEKFRLSENQLTFAPPTVSFLANTTSIRNIHSEYFELP